MKKNQQYGMELIMDLYNCDPKIISSKKKLKEYTVKICKLIKMKRYGKPFIERFGLGMDFTAGYSLAQFIESSLISGHFSELWRSCYINIFTCKSFNAKIAEQFTQKFFGADRVKSRFILRH
ncbi:MAG: S-adenosylmethionine decarboxylase [Candidatus Nealsonbacteria bacterium]